MRNMSLLLITAALASCTTAPPLEPRSAEAEAELQQLIQGRVAGQPTRCLPSYTARSGNMIVIDDNTIAFRNVGGDVYVNNVGSGGCSPLGSGIYTLVTRTSGSGLCSGDISQVVDLTSGMTFGSCALGDFIPYRRS